jgi:hypothetical protein
MIKNLPALLIVFVRAGGFVAGLQFCPALVLHDSEFLGEEGRHVIAGRSFSTTLI